MRAKRPAKSEHLPLYLTSITISCDTQRTMGSIAKPNSLTYQTELCKKQLKIVCDYLGYDNISTHSFRKFYATEIYKNNDCDIELVRHLLQHSSTAITQRYIGIQPPKIEQAISKHICLL